jgi:regulator of sigma E protease
MNFFLGILPFLLLISVIVTIHELGHYSVARLFKTKIERFSVGFGKVLISRRDKNGVLWCLSAIPLGGYVKFSGDEHVASMSPDATELETARRAIREKEGDGAELNYFHFKPVWQRFLIVAAGPFANFLLAIVLFAALLMISGQTIVPASVQAIQPGSAAEIAGFQKGDRIISVDNRKVKDSLDVIRLTSLRAGTPTRYEVIRAEKPITLIATPKRERLTRPDEPEVYGGKLGIAIGNAAISKTYWPHQALIEGTRMTWEALDSTVTYIGRIFIGKESGKELSGILGMTQMTGDITAQASKAEGSTGDKLMSFGLYMLTIAALISVGVGFMNLLPIPILDGGHLVFYTYEAIAQKPLASGIQAMGYRFGLMALIGLMVFATWNDLNRIGVVKFFGGLFS